MKNLEEKIKTFININYNNYNYDYNRGRSCGAGSSSGRGYGFGNGNCGDSLGYGYGYGCGDDCGTGFDGGNKNGDGYGYGCGDGNGYNNNISIFNSDIVYQIDNIPTIIKHVKGNIAYGFIINNDFTLTKCFIAKDDKYFAHGDTLKNAVAAVRQKKWQNMDTETIINEFCKEFKPHEKYKCATFFMWHNFLTGSCELGRKTFMKNHNIEMDDEFTVDEFINLTINDYGGEIIEQLKEQWYETNIK